MCLDKFIITKYSEKPWSRVHLGYAGPMFNYYFLIIVECTKQNPNADFTLNFLYESISRFGLPDEIVSVNGVQFKNSKFIEFTTDLFSIINIRFLHRDIHPLMGMLKVQ